MSRKRPTFSKAVAPPRDLCYNQQKRISFSESIDVIDHIFFFFSVGRFTQEDTHWNASNMIYGDEPQQIGEYEDPLGTSRYVYAPKVSAIKQAANQYGYGLANPVYYCDRNGKMGEMALQWSAGMWWLTLIDGVLPVGDVIYVVGIGVLSIADAINTFGADNVVSLITDAPNVLSESIRSLSHWVQNIGKGGTVPNPGDPNWGKGFKSFRQLKKISGLSGKRKGMASYS